MPDEPSDTPAARGRPLSSQTDQAILDAARGLLAERALSEISIEDIATRARASKASIYRRWSSKGTLAFDAFLAEFLDTQPVADTGRFEGDLLATLHNWVTTVDGTTTGRTLRGLIAEVQRDRELATAWRERFIGPVRERQRAVVERAIARGELPAGTDTDLVLDLLFGPAYHRLLQDHLPLDDTFATGLVKVIVAAVKAGAV
jgi:AcrR family transcriptional regulator